MLDDGLKLLLSDMLGETLALLLIEGLTLALPLTLGETLPL